MTEDGCTFIYTYIDINGWKPGRNNDLIQLTLSYIVSLFQHWGHCYNSIRLITTLHIKPAGQEYQCYMCFLDVSIGIIPLPNVSLNKTRLNDEDISNTCEVWNLLS